MEIHQMYDYLYRLPLRFKWRPGITYLSNPRSAAAPVVAYLCLLLVLKLTIRKPMKVPVLIPALYNAAMSLGSLAMFLGTAIEAFKGPLFFWSYIYFLSKYIEFVDTILLCLKAKPLSFLHVFHHAVVVMMAFLWLAAAQSLQHIALLTNTAIHVAMYAYYCLTSLGVRPSWKRVVTDGQIVQFIFSFAASVPFWVLQLSGRHCSGFRAVLFNTAFNALLLALFINFHRRNYAARKTTEKVA